MGDSNPPIFTLSWEEWEHPRRAMAAIWITVGIAFIISISSIGYLVELDVHPAVSFGTAIILVFLTPFTSLYILTRLNVLY